MNTMVVSFVSCVCPYMRVTLTEPLLLPKLKITKSGGCVRTRKGKVLFWGERSRNREEELSMHLVFE